MQCVPQALACIFRKKLLNFEENEIFTTSCDQIQGVFYSAVVQQISDTLSCIRRSVEISALGDSCRSTLLAEQQATLLLRGSRTLVALATPSLYKHSLLTCSVCAPSAAISAQNSRILRFIQNECHEKAAVHMLYYKVM